MEQTYRITKNTIDYKEDMELSDALLPQVVDILEKQINNKVNRASINDDFNNATDLVSDDGKRICVRIRRDKRKDRDLTIRVKKGDVNTELYKIKQGHGDVYFYGWLKDSGIAEWILVDLHGMRKSGILDTERKLYANRDGYTYFIAFPATELRNHGLLISEQLA